MIEEKPQPLAVMDKAKCLIELQRTLAENRRQTRDIEFRVNISLWTLIAASVWFLHGKVHLSTDSNWVWFLFIAAATYLAHLLLWMRPIQDSEDRDAEQLKEWSRIVEAECGLPVHEVTPKVTVKTGGTKWIIFETLFTALLLVIAGIVLWQ